MFDVDDLPTHMTLDPGGEPPATRSAGQYGFTGVLGMKRPRNRHSTRRQKTVQPERRR